MVEASVSVGSDDLNPLEDPLSNSEMCVPFLGLNAGCSKVARNEWEPAETTATGTSSSDGETSPSENYLTSSGYTSRGSSYNQATLIQTIRTRRSADETHVSSTEMSSFAPVTEAMVSLGKHNNNITV